MTRTCLVKIADQIRDSPIDSYPSAYDHGIVYEGRFMRKPIHCLYTLRGILVAVHYKRVLYLTTATGTTAIRFDISQLYKDHQCNTKVYLYQNSFRLSFIDEDGRYGSEVSAAKSHDCDYSDLIPLPQL